jgi:acyl-CoA thioesterase
MKIKEFILSKITDSPFFKTMSIQLETTNETGSRLRIVYDDKHMNIWGNIHGGVIASLVDTTCGLSMVPLLNDDEMITTAGLQVRYLVPARNTDLVGQGRVVHRGKRLAYAEAYIFDEQERLIAKGHASFAIINGKYRIEGTQPVYCFRLK